MRLIDADAFQEDLENRYCFPCMGAGKDRRGTACCACWVHDWEVYTTDLRQRKIGDHCKELHIATRWSVHDVIGRLEREYAGDERAKFIREDDFCSYGKRKDGGLDAE